MFKFILLLQLRKLIVYYILVIEIEFVYQRIWYLLKHNTDNKY